MASVLTDNTILVPNSNCAIREQTDRYLIYNPATDELHLVPPTGFYAYRLCNGLNTIGDIVRMLAGSDPARHRPWRDRLNDFLGQLVSRGILKIDIV